MMGSVVGIALAVACIGFLVGVPFIGAIGEALAYCRRRLG